jgi:hypothetical protein
VVPIFKFDSCLWLAEELFDEELLLFFKSTSVGKPTHSYYARVTIEKGDFRYCSTLKATEFNTADLLLDGDEKYYMSVPQKEINRFLEKGFLKYNIFFFQEPIQ